jgi:hypothetical protein
VTISITRDIVKQLKLSNSPFSLILDANYNVVDTEDAVDNLPVQCRAGVDDASAIL